MIESVLHTRIAHRIGDLFRPHRRLGVGDCGLVLACLIVCLLTGIIGCSRPSISTSRVVSQQTQAPLDSPAGLVGYLLAEPAVRQAVEWDNPYGQGLVVETAHYRVYTTLTDPLMLRQVPSFLESAFRAYQSQLPVTLVDSEPFIVYLFGTREHWEAFTSELTGDDAKVYLQIQAGAYVVDGVCVAYNIGRRQTFSVLGHEGWHQFTQRLFAYRLPSWLDEGIATLFETCRYEQGRFLFEPRSNLLRLGSLKQALLEGRLIALDELLMLNPGQVLVGYDDNPNGMPSYYAQVYALVRFLREEGYGIRLQAYHTMLLGAALGDWPLEASLRQKAADRSFALTVGWNIQVSRALFSHYFGEDMAAMDAEFRVFCQKITYPIQLRPIQ